MIHVGPVLRKGHLLHFNLADSLPWRNGSGAADHSHANRMHLLMVILWHKVISGATSNPNW